MAHKSGYPELNLYKKYRQRSFQYSLSPDLQDRTVRITMEQMNYAINNCEQWGHFLDIGGGSGHYSSALSALFSKGTIIEIDSYKEHAAIKQRYTNLTIDHSYIESYRSEQKSDFILLADIFEHIPDIKAFIQLIGRLQDVGGVVYVLTPNPNVCGPAPESNIHYTKHPHGHIKHYNPQEITLLMADAGYTPLFLKYEETFYRRKAKNILYGISRRDRKLNQMLMYRFLRPLFSWIFVLIAKYLEISTYRQERRHTDNPFFTISLAMAFKKTT